ncbi:DUF2834 domain-containing protein [Prochlorococcus sp. MIT 1341]|uniref:DUF2834 domain-containing protein n=1 Tax=Prochlorococcus sp. MIT 1341 TaxID=3096221 RepID=UPI002A766257|nr:DUF2834 domain-containing protein [Prochlorococcus sp. MIT 1341]
MSSRNYLSLVYLLLACLGAFFTMQANIDFISEHGPGFDVLLFFRMANENAASRSLTSDLLIGASAITIWILNESKRLQMRNLWIVFLTMFTIAFAFAAPLFLFLRERRLLEMESLRQGSVTDQSENQ